MVGFGIRTREPQGPKLYNPTKRSLRHLGREQTFSRRMPGFWLPLVTQEACRCHQTPRGILEDSWILEEGLSSTYWGLWTSGP